MNAAGPALPITAALLIAAALPACRRPSQAAQSELQTAGYQLTQEDWHRAAADNQVAVMKKFISSGFDPKTPDASGNTALHAAARSGAIDAADYLLDLKLDVNSPGGNSATPLHAAASANQPTLVRWLIKQGANPKLKDAAGFTPLMLAVRENQPRVIAEIAPHNRDELDAALLLAAIHGSKESIDALTSYGASVYARMDDGRTPLMLAAENGKSDAAALLLELGASRFSTDAQGRNAAEIAAASGHQEISDLINRAPSMESLALDTPETIADSLFPHAAADFRTQDAKPGDPPAETAGSGGRPARPLVISRPVSLSGKTLGTAIAAADTAQNAGTASAFAEATRQLPGPEFPPLVMRNYQERELPLRIQGVSGNVATFHIGGAAPRELKVPAGSAIPGTNLEVTRVHRRMEHSKVSPDSTEEISVVDVRDPTTGVTREWIAGRQATGHDPVALVEDPATGNRFIASPGQRFRSASGAEFIVSDVRPNQLVIENAATGESQTLPLRGPRG